MENHEFALFMAAVPLLGILAQWISWRFRLPSILVLLLFGVLLGLVVSPDEIIANASGGNASAVHQILFPIVSLSVAVVLFEGGLTLRFRELNVAGSAVFRLCTIGAAIAWVLSAIAAVYIVGLSVYSAALLGAILTVTGPTVIAPLLRHIKPNRTVSAILKWEGIVIDPIGAVLAVLVFQVIRNVGDELDGSATAAVAMAIARTLIIGGGVGLGAGATLSVMIKRFWIPEYLQSVAALAVALAAFVGSNILQPEAGLVTVTVMGVYLANRKHLVIEHILTFKEHLTILLVSCLFIVLGARVDLAAVGSLGWTALAFVAVLIIIVRPASVFLATIGTDLTWREKCFLACLAPRGIVAAAVSAVFAIELSHSVNAQSLGIDAEKLAPLTFLVICGTVSVYGLTAAPLARWLGLAAARPQGLLIAGAEPWVRSLAETLLKHDILLLLVDTNFSNVAAARMAGISAECASILSEHAKEDFDLGGIGRLLTMTPNDEVNALAAQHFGGLFGRENIYTLPPLDSKGGIRESIPSHLQARPLFTSTITATEFADRIRSGDWEFKATKLTSQFTFDQFTEQYNDDWVLLFIIDASENLKIVTPDFEMEPTEGDTLITLVRNGQTPHDSQPAE